MAKSGGKKSTAAKAAAVAATATETVGAPATDTLAPAAVTDDTIAASEADVKGGQAVVDELVRLREQLERETQLRIAAENQTKAVEQRLVMLNDADAQILVAEKIVRQKMEALTAATEKQKEAKKEFDASVVELRRRVGDRLEGQMTLFDQAALGGAESAETAPAAPSTNGKPKSNRPKPARAATPPAPGTPVETAPATAVATPSTIPDDAREEDKPPMPTPQAVQQAAEEWYLTTALGSVSVPGKSAGEMLSLPPSMVKALAEGGVTNVAQAREMLTRSIPVKGVSAKGRKQLLDIVEKWTETKGGEATAPAPATPAAKPLHNVTSLQRLCGSCQNRWALPSTVLVCPQCNETQLIYDVGYHNNPNADRDGDLVAAQEIVPFTVPETDKTKGLGEYSFCIIMAPDGSGGFVAGYEIKLLDDVAEHHYPNVTDPHLTKAAAMEHGLHLLNQSVLTVFASREAHEQWLAVASERVGVKPVNHGTNPL